MDANEFFNMLFDKVEEALKKFSNEVELVSRDILKFLAKPSQKYIRGYIV